MYQQPQQQYAQPSYADIAAQPRQLSRNPNHYHPHPNHYQYQPNNSATSLYQRQQFIDNPPPINQREQSGFFDNSQTINHQYQPFNVNVATPTFQQQQFAHNPQAINHIDAYQYQYQQSNEDFNNMAYQFYQEQQQQLIASALIMQNQQQIQQQFEQYPQQPHYAQTANYKLDDLNPYKLNYYQSPAQPTNINPNRYNNLKYSAFDHSQQHLQNEYQPESSNNALSVQAQFEETPIETVSTFTTENTENSENYETPKGKATKTKRKKKKNTPSNWTRYYCELPSTPSSEMETDGDDNFHNHYGFMHSDGKSDEKTELTDITETDDCEYLCVESDDCNEDCHGQSLRRWMNLINNKPPQPNLDNVYECNKNRKSYDAVTGGKCFEVEQDSKRATCSSHTASFFCCYLNDIILRKKHNIFYLNAAAIYENIFGYLDGKSILNGIMATCKKLHYFQFMDASRIWRMLLRRDFPRLFRKKYRFVRIPYLDTYASFKATILQREKEKKLYFNKVKQDKFWSLLLNLRHIDLAKMDNDEIECEWRGVKWIDFLIGKNEDCGLGAFAELTKLRHGRYIKCFGKEKLANNELIEHFCNAMRKNMPSGKAIMYLSPWISATRLVQWTRRKILWLREYGRCWALSEANKYYYGELKKIPLLIRLIGKVQFQNGRGFKPSREWLPFLQTFDPTVCTHKEIKDAWFQKQFMLNEMENRLKNVRTLIEIVRP